MPGPSFWLAKATRNRRAWDDAARGASPTTTAPSAKRKRRRPSAGAGAESLTDRLDVDEGAGRAHRLRHRHRQEERRALAARRLRGNQVGANVFDDVDAVVRQQDRVDRK